MGAGAGTGAAGPADMGATLSQLWGGHGRMGGFASPPAVADPEAGYESQLQQL